jgi:hypothetical protein
MKLLWVEDHSQFVRFALPFLAEHSVRVVPSLATARAALAEHRLDVVLVDFDLQDGRYALVEVKATCLKWLDSKTSRLPRFVSSDWHKRG